MVEKSKFAGLVSEPTKKGEQMRSRLSSNVGSDLGEIDLTDLDHCILCFEEMKVTIVG